MNKTCIIIPTYNEKENIEKIIPIIFSLITDILILVVDDNSPDKTSLAVNNLAQKYINLSLLFRERKEGLGRAYINAFKEVLKNGKIERIIMMDADFSHDPQYIPIMIRELEQYDVIIGSRYIKNGGTKGWELWRKILSFCGNLYCKSITQMPISDCTSGFIAIKTDFLRKLDFEKIELSGYAFLIKLKYLLFKSGARIKEIPIIFRNRLEGESKISSHIIREGIITPWKIIFKNRNLTINKYGTTRNKKK